MKLSAQIAVMATDDEMSWNLRYDHIFHIVDAHSSLDALARKHPDELKQNGGDVLLTVAPHIKTIVEKSLGRRAVKVDVKCGNYVELKHDRKADVKAFLGQKTVQLTFGLILSKHDYKATLERGPEANSAAAGEFLSFWGKEASKLRRFPDGSMAEGVAWKAESEGERRVVCGQIIRHAMSRHAAIGKRSLLYVANLWDHVLQFQRLKFPLNAPSSPTGEEYFRQIDSLYNTLSGNIRKMADLPLGIVSIRSTSPILRSTAVFPPIPASFKPSGLHGQQQPLIPAIPVQVVLEGSAKWPNDRRAIARLKTAFQLKIAEYLKGLEYSVVVAEVDGVRVWKEGYCFLVQVVYLGELTLSRKVVLPDGRLQLDDTPEFLRLKEEFDWRPKLAGAISGVLGQEESFGTACRIAKRWINCQLLHDYMPEEAVELIMAQIYVRPQPFDVPSTPDVAFIRFLSLLATHDWHKAPLIVDFKKDMTPTTIAQIKAEFTEKRKSFPLMTVVTHFDATSHWTRTAPTAVILKRLSLLARVSLSAADAARLSGETFDPKTIFRPPASDDWDCLIHLKEKSLARRHEALDLVEESAQIVPDSEQQSRKKGRKGGHHNSSLPLLDLSAATGHHDTPPDISNRILLDFDPADQYLRLLRETYGDFAYFFGDPHGGQLVRVVWKTPNFARNTALEHVDGEAGLAALNGRMAESVGQGTRRAVPLKLSPHLPAMVEDFAILGRGLVQRVQIRPQKWTI